MDAIVYLVPIGAGRFELYSEPAGDTAAAHPSSGDGFWRRQTHRLQARWRAADEASRGVNRGSGVLARARDWTVRRMAESISEQRTLWTLRQAPAASLVHPADLPREQAATARDRLLAAARTMHGCWLLVDAAVFVASGVFVLVPGPNILAYYFAFRVIGHYFSWRGARRALRSTAWDLRAEPALTELGRLTTLPPDARATRLHAIAAELQLPRLAAFFDRAAAPIR